jgi:hypothetical protein
MQMKTPYVYLVRPEQMQREPCVHTDMHYRHILINLDDMHVLEAIRCKVS